MGNDQLDLDSDFKKGAQAHCVNQLPSRQEEEIEEDGDKNPFSSHEGEEEGESTLRKATKRRRGNQMISSTGNISRIDCS
jgi:hypothetical protein